MRFIRHTQNTSEASSEVTKFVSLYQCRLKVDGSPRPHFIYFTTFNLICKISTNQVRRLPLTPKSSNFISNSEYETESALNS